MNLVRIFVATAVGAAAGIVAWYSGVAARAWPAHAAIAACAITFVVSATVTLLWPRRVGRR